MRYDDLPPETVHEAFSDLKVDELKALAKLVGEPPPRKGELVEMLAGVMQDRDKVRALYLKLDDIGQKAVQEAAHDIEGVLDLSKFQAKYGRSPNFGGSSDRYGYKPQPTSLRLFFPHTRILPEDLRSLLHAFVPEPPPLKVETLDDLPPKTQPPQVNLGSYYDKPDDEEVELRVRHTARAALHDVKAVLRLIDAGAVRVGDKTRRPSQAVMKAITGVLAEGDFYAEEDQSEEAGDPAADLRIQAFAWPMLVQAAGLAEAAGTRLQLTAAGRKATTRPAHELSRQIWDKWQKTTLVDEFNRVNAIKGQQSKGRGLTAIAPRRGAVVEVLKECPAQKWISIEEMFRLLKVLPDEFEITHDEWKLYISEQHYGSLGEGGHYTWEVLQGRFTLAFLFEYAATLGLLGRRVHFPGGGPQRLP